MSSNFKETLSAAKRKLLNDDEIISKNKSRSMDYESGDSYKTSRSKKKKEKKSKKKSKKHKKRSSSESSSSSDEEDAWVEKPKASNSPQQKPESESNKREDWMSMTGMFATFTRNDIKPDRDKKNKKNIDDYDPSKSVRELNPYWKDGGTGLPSENIHQANHKEDRRDHSSRERYSSRDSSQRNSQFKRPGYEDDYRRSSNYDKRDYSYDRNDYRDSHSSKKNWQKRPESSSQRSGESSTSDSTREKKEHEEEKIKSDEYSNYSHKPIEVDDELDDKKYFMTDQQMNVIGAKIVKAEILGNTKLVAELTAKLEAAREYKKAHPESATKEEAVMLTVTDDRGNTRPLTKSEHAGDPRSKGGKKKAETHSAAGARMRFFADDDKYSLKQMFEKEKYGSAKESEEEFVKAISKHKNPNDDLDDIFAENILKTKSDAKSDQENFNKAISQHKSVQRSLDCCEYCIESDKMIKHMIVSLGTNAYVALPSRKSLTKGHCYISTVGHVICSTTADENIWSEILSYRRALTNLFNSLNQDVVFFEVAIHLNKYPHILIHCVPLPRDVGDTAPIYFKKAILECEAEWSNNKKVVDLKGKDIRRGVPKGLPYFWIDFGMDPGFAHVIEDQRLFPINFAQEIIGGMLDLDHGLWRKPQKENFETQTKKVLEFTSMWKPFDPNSSN